MQKPIWKTVPSVAGLHFPGALPNFLQDPYLGTQRSPPKGPKRGPLEGSGAVLSGSYHHSMSLLTVIVDPIEIVSANCSRNGKT